MRQGYPGAELTCERRERSEWACWQVEVGKGFVDDPKAFTVWFDLPRCGCQVGLGAPSVRLAVYFRGNASNAQEHDWVNCLAPDLKSALLAMRVPKKPLRVKMIHVRHWV